jgi:hypothetical protein
MSKKPIIDTTNVSERVAITAPDSNITCALSIAWPESEDGVPVGTTNALLIGTNNTV